MLPDDFILVPDDNNSIDQALAYGFEREIELYPDVNNQYLSYILLAAHLPARFDWDSNEIDSETIDRIKSLLDTSRPAINRAANSSIVNDGYNYHVASAFYHSINTLLFLHTLLNFEVNPEDFYQIANDGLNYTDQFKDDNHIAALFATDISINYIIANFVFNDFDLDQIDQDYIRLLLRNNVYTINDTFLAWREPLFEPVDAQNITNRDYRQNHRQIRQRVYKLLANEVDPEFKTFLVERIPGWDQVDFEPSED